MNKTVLILFSIAFYACNQNKQTETVIGRDTAYVAATKPDSIRIKQDMHYYWEASPDDKSNKLVIRRLRPISADSLNVDYLISQINYRYEHIKLRFVKISNDTLFVKIGQSDFLTQQLGSTGAEIYITEATYNLSELKNIGYVHFDFKEGDHAAPGTYSRSDFVNIKFSSQQSRR